MTAPATAPTEPYTMSVACEPPPAGEPDAPWRAWTEGGDACTGRHADPYLAVVAAAARKGFSFHEDQIADGEADPSEAAIWRRIMDAVAEIPR